MLGLDGIGSQLQGLQPVLQGAGTLLSGVRPLIQGGGHPLLGGHHHKHKQTILGSGLLISSLLPIIQHATSSNQQEPHQQNKNYLSVNSRSNSAAKIIKPARKAQPIRDKMTKVKSGKNRSS